VAVRFEIKQSKAKRLTLAFVLPLAREKMGKKGKSVLAFV